MVNEFCIKGVWGNAGNFFEKGQSTFFVCVISRVQYKNLRNLFLCKKLQLFIYALFRKKSYSFFAFDS